MMPRALASYQWPGFESHLALKGFSLVTFSGFPVSSSKNNTFKFQFHLEPTDTFKRVLKNSQVLRGQPINNRSDVLTKSLVIKKRSETFRQLGSALY